MQPSLILNILVEFYSNFFPTVYLNLIIKKLTITKIQKTLLFNSLLRVIFIIFLKVMWCFSA